jgi:S1-C subfamily serine protease
MRRFILHPSSFILLLLLAGLGCSSAGALIDRLISPTPMPVMTPIVEAPVMPVVTPTAPPALAIDPAATLAAVPQALLPTPTPSPLPAQDAAIDAGVQGTANVPAGEVADAAAFNAAAAIDAAGLDIEERRVIDLYARVSPSVVNVTTQVLRRYFFYDEVPEAGAGSGFVLDRQGHILTNYHVIEGAQRIEVAFGDDDVYPAEVTGVDPRNDIAVLRVDAPAEKLVPVVLGTSSNLQVGQRTVAIGNPFGQFGRTLTTGVISALDRTLEGEDGSPITGVIQTDAAINRGNSGGPLLDSSGRVIGINSAIFSPTASNAGIGFAVPIDTVHRLLPDLLALGRYRHPWLGVRYAYTLTPGLAEILDLPVNNGLLLVEMFDNGPLAAADVRGAQEEKIVGNQRVYVGGDILTAIDGQPITSIDSLTTLLEDDYRVGDNVTLGLLRDGDTLDVSVTLGEEPTSRR